MKFSDIFWTTWKIRTSIKIQQKIENAVSESRERAQWNSNLPKIVQEIVNADNNFGSFLEKQRKLIQVEKALRNLPQMSLTNDEKKLAQEELLKLKHYLEK